MFAEKAAYLFSVDTARTIYVHKKLNILYTTITIIYTVIAVIIYLIN